MRIVLGTLLVLSAVLPLGCQGPCPEHSYAYCEADNARCGECRAEVCWDWVDGGVGGSLERDSSAACQPAPAPVVVASPAEAPIDAGCEVPAEIADCFKSGDPAAKCCAIPGYSGSSCGVCP